MLTLQSEIVDNLVKEQGVAPSFSPGKHVPIKALAYTLLDDQHSPEVKFTALQKDHHLPVIVNALKSVLIDSGLYYMTVMQAKSIFINTVQGTKPSPSICIGVRPKRCSMCGIHWSLSLYLSSRRHLGSSNLPL